MRLRVALRQIKTFFCLKFMLNKLQREKETKLSQLKRKEKKRYDKIMAERDERNYESDRGLIGIG